MTGVEEESLTFARAWRLAVQNVWAGVGIISISVIAAVLLAFVLQPTYRSTVLLAPARHAGIENMLGGQMQAGALGLLRGLQTPKENLTAEALAILQSRQFIERFIEKHSLLPQLFPSRWNGQQSQWIEEPPALEDGYLRFVRAVLKVREDEETGFVKVHVHGRSAAVAARWANDLVRDLNDEIRERAVSEGTLDLTYLHARMVEAQVPEIRVSIANLIRDQTQEVMLATNRESFAFRVLEEAVPSKYRFSPKRALIVIAGFIVGALVTLVWIAFKESWVTARREELWS